MNPGQTDTRNIAALIRNQREQKYYSQEYMAAKMGIGQNCYSKIELGKSKLTVERLLVICRLLELDVREVFQPVYELID